MNQPEFKERCGICEEEKDTGIHIYQMFVCTSCERRIVQTEPEASEYKTFIEKLKGIAQPTLYS